MDLTEKEKYIFLKKTTDPFILVWFGKYVFKLSNIRREHNMMLLYWQNSDVWSNYCDGTPWLVS